MPASSSLMRQQLERAVPQLEDESPAHLHKMYSDGLPVAFTALLTTTY